MGFLTADSAMTESMMEERVILELIMTAVSMTVQSIAAYSICVLVKILLASADMAMVVPARMGCSMVQLIKITLRIFAAVILEFVMIVAVMRFWDAQALSCMPLVVDSTGRPLCDSKVCCACKFCV